MIPYKCDQEKYPAQGRYILARDAGCLACGTTGHGEHLECLR